MRSHERLLAALALDEGHSDGVSANDSEEAADICIASGTLLAGVGSCGRGGLGVGIDLESLDWRVGHSQQLAVFHFDVREAVRNIQKSEGEVLDLFEDW